MRPNLWTLCEEEGIIIMRCPLRPERGFYGFIWQRSGLTVIVLDSSLHKYPRLERCVLAEELGHYFTGTITQSVTINHNPWPHTELSEEEHRALVWATEYLLPTTRFMMSLEHAHCISCLANDWNVTEWFVHRKLDFMGVSRMPLAAAIH